MDSEETLQVLTKMLNICCRDAHINDVTLYNLAFQNAVKAIVYYASNHDLEKTADLMVRAMVSYMKEQVKPENNDN